jgi:hypothetical protein
LSQEDLVPACKLDHIVVAAASLEAGVAFIRERLGVDIPAGGKHELMGTHNHVMRLGEASYLEVIAVDPDAPKPARPRWYALDDPAMQTRLREHPRIITWVVRTADIVATVQAAAVPLGQVVPVSRGTLSWRLTVPRDGHLPEGGVVPHLIQWDGGARPWEKMADRSCRLDELTLMHPDPDRLRQALATLCDRGFKRIAFEKGAALGLSAQISTPSGVVRI